MKNFWLKKNSAKSCKGFPQDDCNSLCQLSSGEGNFAWCYGGYFMENEEVNPQFPSMYGNTVYYTSFANVAEYITGTVYHNGIAIQTFFVDDLGNITFTKLAEHHSVFVESGVFHKKSNSLFFKWNTDLIQENFLVCSYEYNGLFRFNNIDADSGNAAI